MVHGTNSPRCKPMRIQRTCFHFVVIIRKYAFCGIPFQKRIKVRLHVCFDIALGITLNEIFENVPNYSPEFAFIFSRCGVGEISF